MQEFMLLLPLLLRIVAIPGRLVEEVLREKGLRSP